MWLTMKRRQFLKKRYIVLKNKENFPNCGMMIDLGIENQTENEMKKTYVEVKWYEN